jgi:hypothetical protein
VDSAFAHRDPLFLVEHNADVDGSASDEIRISVQDWVSQSWTTLHPWGSGQIYPNYPDPGLAGWATAYYGSNLRRLTGVKDKYDPQGLFAFAQSVPHTNR